MAADGPRAWGDLHPETVTQIAVRVPCAIDRARMAAVCRLWQAGVAQTPPKRPRLPSLLLAPGDGIGVYCYLSGRRAHDTLPSARHFGSFDGAWVFLAYGQTCGHRLLNVATGASRSLPDVFMDDEERPLHEMAVLGATLSRPPDEQGCFVGAVITYKPDADEPRRRHVAFCRPGEVLAYCNVMPAAPVGPGFEPEDVVYHCDSFHFLTRAEHVLVCTPILDSDFSLLANLSELLHFQGRGKGGDGVVLARYLVASRGELLMVVRLSTHPQAPTSSFKVFQMVQRPMTGDKPDEYFWSELHALGGRMLFVGRGCSRSYDVADYPGFKDAIYFLDEGTFYNDPMVFRPVDERRYPCNDNGKWSPGPPPQVDRYFPEQVPSNNSPPVWLLH